jgi:hypothetical protein
MHLAPSRPAPLIDPAQRIESLCLASGVVGPFDMPPWNRQRPFRNAVMMQGRTLLSGLGAAELNTSAEFAEQAPLRPRRLALIAAQLAYLTDQVRHLVHFPHLPSPPQPKASEP